MSTQDSTNILARVHKGMVVHDQYGKPLGVVDEVVMGGEQGGNVANSGAMPVAPQVNMSGSGASIANIQHVDHIDADLPEGLRDHLLHSGYVRVRPEGALATKNYFVMPGQIGHVSEDDIKLTLPEAQLVKA